MILPAEDYRRTRLANPGKLPQGADGWVHALTGWYRRRGAVGRAIEREAVKISEQARELRHLSDRRLKERLAECRQAFRRQQKNHEQMLPQALAAIVEASTRTLGLTPYPVQIIGAIALHRGCLAEMATGEGKSLTACLPSVLAAWTGRPFHFVTVNDYLASRDAVEMAPLYDYCGATVGLVTAEMEPDERRRNYGCGVVYTTLKELVADLLRDRLRYGPLHHPSRRLLRQLADPRLRELQGVVLRGLDTVIVDEADSVLIDEAVTPLIISRARKNEPLTEACARAHSIALDLTAGEDYRVDERYREIALTGAGYRKLERRGGQLQGIWRGPARREELVRQALTAREFYKENQQFVVQDGKLTIVDEFTGRLMPNRTWREGLQQAVEVKEGLEASDPSETLARLSFQRFFRLFRKLGGMTGTASEAAAEFWHIYRLPVIKVPTHRPCIRKCLPDAFFASEADKWEAVALEIGKWRQSGRPVLVGTRSVRASERLAAQLQARGIECNLLNAVRHREEAQIVAAAGEENRVTIATNMAGRGTDIKLGRGVADRGGLHVIATERHESGRIDRQLFGRCARQGDPGSAQAYISAEDELCRRFVPSPLRNRLRAALAAGLPGAGLLMEAARFHAQRTAERLAYRQRVNVLKMDRWLEDALSFTGPGAEI